MASTQPFTLIQPPDGQKFSPNFVPNNSPAPKKAHKMQLDPSGPQWDPMRNTWYTINQNGDRIRVQRGNASNEERIRKYVKEYKGIDSIPDPFPNDYKPPETILTAIKKISKGSTNVSQDGKELTIDPLKVTQSCNSVLYSNIGPEDQKPEEIILDPKKYGDMTIEEAKTIVSYTYNASESEKNELSPFKEINSILRSGNSVEIKESIDMIYMLLKSLRKIPPKDCPTLYRGVAATLNKDGKLVGRNGEVFQPELVYKVGETVTFGSLTSTSIKRSPALTFFGKKKEGIVFKIHGGRGYDVMPFSMFPTEEEIVMDIESKFVVTSIKEEKWDLTEILKEEKVENVDRKERGSIKFGGPERPEGPDFYKVTLIELKYIREKLPFQEAIERMMKKESKTVPLVDAYRKSKAPHAESSSDDEKITCSTNSGMAIRLNLRTGEIENMGSTIGLPKGWVELTENVDGIEVKYYTNGAKKQYERPPQTEPYKITYDVK